MIEPTEINLDALPWVPLKATNGFPEDPAIYFAIDSQGVVQYVGRSINVKYRWKSHHKYESLEQIGGVKIAYLFIDAPEILEEIESALISWFDPPLNVIRVGVPRETQGDHRLRNKIKDFLSKRGITAYQFIKDTGIAPTTGYKLAKDPKHLPAIRVVEAICDTYQVQPGELLEWIDEA